MSRKRKNLSPNPDEKVKLRKMSDKNFSETEEPSNSTPPTSSSNVENLPPSQALPGERDAPFGGLSNHFGIDTVQTRELSGMLLNQGTGRTSLPYVMKLFNTSNVSHELGLTNGSPVPQEQSLTNGSPVLQELGPTNGSCISQTSTHVDDAASEAQYDALIEWVFHQGRHAPLTTAESPLPPSTEAELREEAQNTDPFTQQLMNSVSMSSSTSPIFADGLTREEANLIFSVDGIDVLDFM